jgi:small subunit ribosomal protein S16
MSVSIRLARIGKKKAPFYRIVAVDKRKKRDGQYLENLGTYNPLTGEIVQFHTEQFDAWVQKGALPSDTVLKIKKQYSKNGIGTPKKVAPKVEAAPTLKEAKEAKVEAVPVKAEVKFEEIKEEAKTDDK